MKAIGFNNFRKFQNFPMMELGGVNVFVGTNNSGKSTAIKAMILLLDNILSWERHPDFGIPFSRGFRFTTESNSHLYLGGYENSINSDANGKPMSFSFITGNTRVSFCLCSGEKEQKDSIGTSLQVFLKHLEIENLQTKVVFYYDFDLRGFRNNGDIRISVPKNNLVSGLKELICSIRRTNMKGENKEFSMSNFIPSILFGAVGTVVRSLYKTIKGKLSWDIEKLELEQSCLSSISDEQINILSRFQFSKLMSKASQKDISEALISKVEKYGDFSSYYINVSFNQIIEDINNLSTFNYVEAHNATHKHFVNIEDKDDFLSQTLSKFLGEGVMDNNKVVDFVNKWLDTLNIADRFLIKNPFEGMYMVNLLNKNNEAKPLGSYGTGSIQIFILLLQIAISIHSNKNIIMFVEEPEQNLHPSLQSRLADLFYEVWNMTKGKVRFVVETHSEYLVRKMQVIVANAILSERKSIDKVNQDIKVYYFPDKKEPYPMVFKNNGRFQNKFGQGFFDESSRANYELVLLENRD